MSKFKVKAIVKLKDNVFDSRGDAASNIVSKLGFEENPNILCGKYFEFEVSEISKKLATQKAEEICVQFFTNATLEQFEILEITKL